MDRHYDTVASISSSVRHFYGRKEPFRIYHGATNSTRPLYFKRDKMVDTSSLSHVIKINTSARTVLVEPNVPMDALVKATLEVGLLPPVVMEFPGITVGGGFAGTAGESSSFKYGFFDRTANWIEIILANGDIVKASETEKPDLFYGAAGTFGTLGVLTLLELQLIPAKKYVKSTYYPIKSLLEATSKLEEAAQDPSIDYLDGILFGLDKGVIIASRLTDTIDDGAPVQQFSRARDPWYYLHVEDIFKRSTIPSAETVPLVDYLFRYDRGAFWTGAYAFKYFMTPFNRVTRWALDYFMHTRVMYHALHESGQSQRYIIQDIALPYPTAQQFIEYVDKVLGCYPLWLCPLLQHKEHQVSLQPHTSSAGTRNGMLLNVGVWGPGPNSRNEFVAVNRAIEHKVRDLSGMKWLYAHTYYTEWEFWKIYDRKWYDDLRAKYQATSLPTVYDKVKVDIAALEVQTRTLTGLYSIWPFSGLRGVAKAILGGDYVLAPDRPRHRMRSILLVLTSLVIAMIGGLLLQL